MSETAPEAPPDADDLDARRRTGLLGILGLGHVCSDFYATMLNPILPELGRLFGLSIAQTQLMPMLGGIFGSMAQPFVGAFGDHIGRKRLVIAGTAMAAVFTCAIGYASGLLGLLALLICGALGVAFFHPNSASLVTLFSLRRGLSFAVFLVGGSVGLALAPIVVTAVVSDSSVLIPDDIPDWAASRAALARDRAKGEETPGGRLWARMSPQARQAVFGDGEVEADAAVSGLNEALAQPDLFREATFGSSKMPREAREFLQRDRSKLSRRQVRTCNRMLLEAAYPNAVRSSVARVQSDLKHLVWLSLPGIALAVLLALILPSGEKGVPASRSTANLGELFGPGCGMLWLLFVIVTLRSTVFTAFSSFMGYLSEQNGWSMGQRGRALALFMASTAVGGILGGWLSDGMDRRTLLAASCLLAAPLLAAFAVTPSYPAALALLVPAGVVVSLATPIVIVCAQEFCPSNQSTASGMMMGLAWGLATMCLPLLGKVAEIEAVKTSGVLAATSALAGVAGLLSFFLPRLPPHGTGEAQRA